MHDMMDLLLLAGAPEGVQLFTSAVARAEVVLPWLEVESNALALVLGGQGASRGQSLPRAASCWAGLSCAAVAAPAEHVRQNCTPAMSRYGMAHGPALPTSHPYLPAVGEQPSILKLAKFSTVLMHLLRGPPFRHIPRALAARPSTQRAIADLSLSHLLAHLAPAVEAAAAAGSPAGAAVAAAADGTTPALRNEDVPYGMGFSLGQALECEALRPAIKRHLRTPGCALPAVQHVARVLWALPAARPDGTPAPVFRKMRLHALLLFGLFPFLTASASDSGDDGSILANSALLGPHAAMLRQEQQAAAWELVRLLPHWAAVIEAAAGDSELPLGDLATFVFCSRSAVDLLLDQAGTIDSPQQCADMAAAAEATARLQPLLLRLDADWQRIHPTAAPLDAGELTPPCEVAAILWQHIWYAGTNKCFTWAQSRAGPQWSGAALPALADPYDQPQSLPRLLWQLHSRSCRMLHWIASRRTHALVPDGGRSRDWRVTQQTLNLQLCSGLLSASGELQAAGGQGCR